MTALRELQERISDQILLGAAKWVKENYGDEIPDWAAEAIGRKVMEIEERTGG